MRPNRAALINPFALFWGSAHFFSFCTALTPFWHQFYLLRTPKDQLKPAFGWLKPVFGQLKPAFGRLKPAFLPAKVGLRPAKALKPAFGRLRPAFGQPRPAKSGSPVAAPSLGQPKFVFGAKMIKNHISGPGDVKIGFLTSKQLINHESN